MLAVGKKAPAFQLDSSDGTQVKLADLAGKIVVVYFYPRDNTPGCTIEAQDFTKAIPELTKLGAVVFGVSKDSIASHCKFRDKYGLTFPLLTDPDGKVMEAYGAWGEKVMYGKKMLGIIRSTVVIDQTGTVVRHWPKVSVKSHVDEVVATVKALASGGTAAAPASTAAKPAATSAAKPAATSAAKSAAKKPAAKKPAAKAAPKNKAPAKKPAKKR